jgi:hypothetical protein
MKEPPETRRRRSNRGSDPACGPQRPHRMDTMKRSSSLVQRLQSIRRGGWVFGSANLVEAMEVAAWQARPLFFDAPRVKIRDEGLVRNEPVHIALGVQPTAPIPELWLEQNEGCQILTACHDRVEVPRRRGCAGRRRRRPERIPRRDHRRLPAGYDSDLHRPPAALQP